MVLIRTHLKEKEIEEICHLWGKGYTVRGIAVTVNHDPATVKKILKRFPDFPG